MSASNAYGRELDDDAIDYSESEVVNVTDEDVQFTIATHPGSKPRRYTLAPFGQPKCAIHIEDGYTRPCSGAGRALRKPIIESKTMREVFPGGKSLPMVVHHEQARDARKRWVDELKKAPPEHRVAMQMPREPRMQSPTRASSSSPPNLEEVDQTEIEAPHPDDAPVIANGPPAAPPPKGKGK